MKINKYFKCVRFEIMAVTMNRTIFKDVMPCLPKFWRNVLCPSSGSKRKSSKQTADRMT